MKNIGIIVDNSFNSDIRVRKEVGILQKHGYRIFVLCFAFDGKIYPDIEGIKISRIKIKKRTKDIFFFFLNRIPLYEHLWKEEIKNFITENSIEILHVHDLYMSKAAHRGIKLSKHDISMILDLHENFPIAIQSYNWTKGLLRRLLSNPKVWIKKEQEYLSYASSIVVLSEFFKQELLNRYDNLNKNDIISFPNVIDFRQFESYKINPAIKKNEKVTLLYFGAVAERRGIFEAINAFKSGLKEGLNIELLIIGPVDKADNARFFDIINNPEVKESIKYIPWIDISELVTYLHISDICLSPLIKNAQHESGVANKIFQYMFGKKPVIVSDCRPQKELIESYNCGLVYSTEGEFVSCIKHLVNHPKLRKNLGKNGYQLLYKNFDSKKYEGILLSIYER